MQHPDDGTLHAWIDGELAAESAAELERHVAHCPVCASALAEARGFVAGASRVVSALDGAPAAVRSTASTPGAVPRSAPRRRFLVPLRAAAAVLVVAGSALVVSRLAVNRSAVEMIEPSPTLPGTPAPAVANVSAERQTDLTRREPVPEPSATPPVRAQRDERKERDAPGVTDFAAASAEEAPATPVAERRVSELSEVTVTGVVAREPVDSPIRVTRYRLESGVIVTLAENMLIEEGVRADTRAMQSAAAARSPAPGTAAINSYRWESRERRRVYTLSGPLSVKELEETARRLGELQPVP